MNGDLVIFYTTILTWVKELRPEFRLGSVALKKLSLSGIYYDNNKDVFSIRLLLSTFMTKVIVFATQVQAKYKNSLYRGFIMGSNSFASLQRTVRWIEWAVLLADLAANLLDSHFQNRPQVLPILCLYVGMFFLLSWELPINRPVWQRRTYILIEIVLILSAMGMQLWFEILLYFVLVKSCLLLQKREVIFVALVLGIGRVSIIHWILPARILKMVAQIQRGDINAVFNPQSILQLQAIGYLGTSLFAICFGFVLVAERQSRQRSEFLAQQIETQAATLERTRIAREIHDSLGHSLTTLGVQLELAQRLFDRDQTQAGNALVIAQQLTNQCLQDVRRSVQTIRQTDFDLNQSLQMLAAQVQRNQPLQVQLNLQLPKLSVQISHQLYCIVLEGLTNIQKHSQATLVCLSGSVTAAEIEIDLWDNGIGFNPNLPSTGFGLSGIQERIQLLHGQVKICSTEGQGTHIQVKIPHDSSTFS
jgi:signal transduction histidine kinase